MRRRSSSRLAILFIVVIALAGLGFVVVKALGGEEVKLPKGMQITLPDGQQPRSSIERGTPNVHVYRFPAGCQIRYTRRTSRRRPARSVRGRCAEPAAVDSPADAARQR